MSAWSARITTNKRGGDGGTTDNLWGTCCAWEAHSNPRSKSDKDKQSEASWLVPSLGIGWNQIGHGIGCATRTVAGWPGSELSVDNLTDLFIYESQMHLSRSSPPPPVRPLPPHNGLCGRHEIEIANKSQFYRHARVTWPFEWMDGWMDGWKDGRTQVDGVEIPDKHFAVCLLGKHMSYSMLVTYPPHR